MTVPHIPADTTANLVRMLDLTPAASVGGDESFSGVTLTRESPRTFGGQVLAQALVAAQRTVEGKQLHSVHGYFLRPGDITKPLYYASQRLNDGRSFATRRVQAFQESGDAPEFEPGAEVYENPQAIFSAIASFQVPAAGVEHQLPVMPQGLPDPESLPRVSDYLGAVQHPVAQAVAWERPIDIRYVSAPLYTQPDEFSTEPQAVVWFKTFDELVNPDGSAVPEVYHQAAIAYASDYLPLEPALRAHSKFWLQPGMKSASLDHAMWFHRPARADRWLVYVLDSPSAQGGRMLARGSIFTAEGELVATVAQEMMFRLPEFAPAA